MYGLACAGCGEPFVNKEPLSMQECITLYDDAFYHMEPCFLFAVEEKRQWIASDPEHHFALPHEDRL